MDTSHNRVWLEPGIVMSWIRSPVIAMQLTCMSESLSWRIAMLAKSRYEVRVVPILLSCALERVSAITFCLPMMC